MVEHRTCNADMVVQFYQKAPIKYIINPVYNCNIMWLGIIRQVVRHKDTFVRLL